MSKMSNLFDQDNMFFTIMGVLFDLIILNVLTLLCCIPIVTAGASFTAMHNVLWHMVRHEETYVSRQFFDSFKRNLKQSLLPWLAFLLAAAVLTVDGMLAWSSDALRIPMMIVVVFAGLVIIAIAQYFFPVAVPLRQSHVDDAEERGETRAWLLPMHAVHAGDTCRFRRVIRAVFRLRYSAIADDGYFATAILLRMDLQLDFSPCRW